MQADAVIPWGSVLNFLSSRRGLLDAVVFSGGEPTLQPALLEAIGEVRALGFRVGLHSAGMAPEFFAGLLPSLDWVGFDVKAPFGTYSGITGIERSGEKALKSLQKLLSSGIPYEVRVTVHPSLLDPGDMIELKAKLLDLGIQNFVVQQVRLRGTLPGRLPPTPETLALPANYGSGFSRFEVR